MTAKAKVLCVKCSRCRGKGFVALTGVYADTLALVKRNPGLNGAQLAELAGCKATAMNNRLRALEDRGLASGEQYGRQTIWTSTNPEKTHA